MVFVFVSFVVVSLAVLPSLVCVLVVTVLFSVVPFWLSQPMVNTPSAEIRTNARKLFISMSFVIFGVASSPAGNIPAGSSKNQSTLCSRAASAPIMPRQSLLTANLGKLHACRSSAYSFFTGTPSEATGNVPHDQEHHYDQ